LPETPNEDIDKNLLKFDVSEMEMLENDFPKLFWKAPPQNICV